MNKALLIVLAVSLTGCAAQVITSSPRSVIVKAGPLDADGAMKLASAECGKHGRHPRVTARPTDANPVNWVFDCVE